MLCGTLDTNDVPSFAVVNELCISGCKSLKNLSKQLVQLSASYHKGDFSDSGVIIYKSLLQFLESVNNMQDALQIAGKSMCTELDPENTKQPTFPETFIITAKEYVFLNKIFEEYTRITLSTSEPFSLFSSPLIKEPCPDNEKKLKAS